MSKLVQQKITSYIGKTKIISKQHGKNQLESTKDTLQENQSTGSLLDVKIEQNNLNQTVNINISPQTETLRNDINQQVNRPRRIGQILLTEMRFTTDGNQLPFHKICAECELRLRNPKSKVNGRGPVCHKRHLQRKSKK